MEDKFLQQLKKGILEMLVMTALILLMSLAGFWALGHMRKK